MGMKVYRRENDGNELGMGMERYLKNRLNKQKTTKIDLSKK